MKYLLWGGILIVGLVVGYLIGQGGPSNEVVEEATQKGQTEFITEVIRDTVVQKERVEVPVLNDTIALLDSLSDSTLAFLDSSLVNNANPDSNEVDNDLTIRREKKIKQITLPIIYLTEEEDKDTLIKEMLGITENRNKTIVVEFWESPLNFSGYKLSRKKLVLYGLSPQHDYSLYRKEKDYYLSAHKVFYSMRETQEFRKYIEVSRDVVFND